MADATTSRIRHDWYQNDDSVTVTIYIKNVKENDLEVNLQPRSLTVSLKLPTGADAVVDFDPLAHEIDVDASSHKVYGTKIDVTLKKKEPGVKWGKLEGEDNAPQTATAPTPAPAHPYPSSRSKEGRDWERVAENAFQEATEGEDPTLGSGDPNDFFKMLFKDADDNTKKAMIKSYVESGGTALSTNWKEVSKDKVEVKPPEGMEARQWG